MPMTKFSAKNYQSYHDCSLACFCFDTCIPILIFGSINRCPRTTNDAIIYIILVAITSHNNNNGLRPKVVKQLLKKITDLFGKSPEGKKEEF